MIAVLSDIHFGYERCTLNTTHARSAKNINVLCAELEKNKVSEIIFLGDIFELQICDFATAFRESDSFFSALGALSNLKLVTFVPGNHDHVLWNYHVVRKEIVSKLDSGTNAVPDEKFSFVRHQFGSAETFLKRLSVNPKVEVAVEYPFLMREVDGRRYLFLHGHFLDSAQMLTYTLTTKLLPGKPTVGDIEQLEVYASQQYLLLTNIAQTEYGRAGIRKRFNQLFGWFKEKGIYSDFAKLREHVQDYAGLWMTSGNPVFKMANYIIYGHTHLPGVEKINWVGTSHVATLNTGAWVDDQREGSVVLIGHKNTAPILYEIKSGAASLTTHPDNNKRRIDLVKIAIEDASLTPGITRSIRDFLGGPGKSL